jgi:hypothetical protein
MEPTGAKITDSELIDRLRRAASIWFKNEDLLLLEELIRRFHYAKPRESSVK